MSTQRDDQIAFLAEQLLKIKIDTNKIGQRNVRGLCAGALYALAQARNCEQSRSDFAKYQEDRDAQRKDLDDLILSLQQRALAPPLSWLIGYYINDAGRRITMAYEGAVKLLRRDGDENLSWAQKVRRARDRGVVIPPREQMHVERLREKFRNLLVHASGPLIDSIKVEVRHETEPKGLTEVESLTTALAELLPIFADIVTAVSADKSVPILPVETHDVERDEGHVQAVT